MLFLLSFFFFFLPLLLWHVLSVQAEMNGVSLDGRNIRVDFSITKRPHSPTPGMYKGVPDRSVQFVSC